MKRKQAASLPKSVQLFITIGLSLIAAVASAIGCSWPGTSHSVRFNAYQTEREMGRLPPLPTMANGMNEARAFWDIEEEPVEDDSVSVDPARQSAVGEKHPVESWRTNGPTLATKSCCVHSNSLSA